LCSLACAVVLPPSSPTCNCRVLVDEGQHRPAWATAFLALEAQHQRAFAAPCDVAEATLACVAGWETATDFDRIGAALDAASTALKARNPSW